MSGEQHGGDGRKKAGNWWCAVCPTQKNKLLLYYKTVSSIIALCATILSLYITINE